MKHLKKKKLLASDQNCLLLVGCVLGTVIVVVTWPLLLPLDLAVGLGQTWRHSLSRLDSGRSLSFPFLSFTDTHLLDCSCEGVIALALGSSVYLWNSQTGALAGSLDPSPQPGLARHRAPSISCLSWSRDGGVLCIGTRQGEIQVAWKERGGWDWFM